jgi:hypothetical protein
VDGQHVSGRIGGVIARLVEQNKHSDGGRGEFQLIKLDYADALPLYINSLRWNRHHRVGYVDHNAGRYVELAYQGSDRSAAGHFERWRFFA